MTRTYTTKTIYTDSNLNRGKNICPVCGQFFYPSDLLSHYHNHIQEEISHVEKEHLEHCEHCQAKHFLEKEVIDER